MKLKQAYLIIGMLFVVMVAVLWKLNTNYKAEKMGFTQAQLQQQLVSLKSPVISQLSQLRNTLSGYQYKFEEAQLNWVQIKPFYFLAKVTETAQNEINIEQSFSLSGTVAERWSASAVKNFLKAKVKSNELLRAQMFQDSAGVKHLALIFFSQDKATNPQRQGMLVIGDTSFFQKLFDQQRTQQSIQSLMTKEQLVVAHTEYDYVANISQENKLSLQKFFVEKEDLRGSNLTLMSYSPKKNASIFFIPAALIGFVVGLFLLASALLIYLIKPESETTKANVVQSPKQPLQTNKVEDVIKPTGLNTPRKENLTKAPLVKPLLYTDETKIVEGVVHTSLMQALFNQDRLLKEHKVQVSKEFVAVHFVKNDYPQMIRSFEYLIQEIVHALVENSSSQLKALKIQWRSYDLEQHSVIEVQAPVTAIRLQPLFLETVKSNSCLIEQTLSSAGECLIKFKFTQSSQVPLENRMTISEDLINSQIDQQLKSSGLQFTSQEQAVEKTTPVEKQSLPPEGTQSTKPVSSQEELDLDQLLSLDDIEVKPSAQNSSLKFSEISTKDSMSETSIQKENSTKVDLEKEMKTTKFRLDERLTLLDEKLTLIEEPKAKQFLNFENIEKKKTISETNEKKASAANSHTSSLSSSAEVKKLDQVQVKIRRPDKR